MPAACVSVCLRRGLVVCFQANQIFFPIDYTYMYIFEFIVSESALAKPAAGVRVRLAGLSTLSSLHYC